ncbi:uncharacterized protein PFL1_04129 [Pseudozyma flocculosa PF-1]|uniref:Uncharacterized protein n=2 Tax=Pseudozyma flocculosa TaxID=84751 RepID=A0A5C3ET55_9BASI|nr:uncharacterized protein PFL1_04129 [Pseudozyma flocculosa PF-1]EPQ28302.1 hypothetical protein PFL1_04129 [Pseudozyma flocculosa PF-1]SPO35448.1 uncharacterized protein PSFLO_00919 [Pseudozyma flocculosa]
MAKAVPSPPLTSTRSLSLVEADETARPTTQASAFEQDITVQGLVIAQDCLQIAPPADGSHRDRTALLPEDLSALDPATGFGRGKIRTCFAMGAERGPADSIKGLEHRRTTSDFFDAHKATGRTPPRAPLPRAIQPVTLAHQQLRTDGRDEDDGDDDDEDHAERAIEAALIRFQWIPEARRALRGPGLGSLAIPTSDTVEMLCSPVLGPASKKPGHGRGISGSKSLRGRSKSSASSLRDVFTDAEAESGRRSTDRRRTGTGTRASSQGAKDGEKVTIPSLLSTESLDLSQFNFPPPPKTLRERHSHGSLRAAAAAGGQIRHRLAYPTEPSPPLRIAPLPPLLPARSPLRERRSKPPLHLALVGKTTSTTATSSSSSRKHSLPSPDLSKALHVASPFSPPPCPPPATPLPDLPTPGSEDGGCFPGALLRSTVHSRKGSAASAPTASRRSSDASDTHHGVAPAITAIKGLPQLHKRSFVRAHSASPSIPKPRASSAGRGEARATGGTVPDTPPWTGAKDAFNVVAASLQANTTSMTGYQHVSSDDFFRMLDAAPPLSPPPSARNSSQRPSDRAKLANLVECLSPSMESSDGVFAERQASSGQGGFGMVRVSTEPLGPARSHAAEVASSHRLSHPADLPMGIEGGDRVVYGLAL